jgi:hypothetical protein
LKYPAIGHGNWPKKDVDYRPEAEVFARNVLPGTLRDLYLGHLDVKGQPLQSVRHAFATAVATSRLWMA